MVNRKQIRNWLYFWPLINKINLISFLTIFWICTMERNKLIQYGLLGVLLLLLGFNLVGGGFDKWFGKGEGSRIRESAVMFGNSESGIGASTSSGNIPNTNVNNPPTDMKITSIKYDSDRFDFGVCNEGDVMTHVFKFTNTGNEPLVITNARGSCGCTVPTWPKEPVPPGGSGEIKVEFNSKGKPGPQSKRVTVTANTNPTDTFLEISGEVRGKEQPSAKSAG